MKKEACSIMLAVLLAGCSGCGGCKETPLPPQEASNSPVATMAPEVTKEPEATPEPTVTKKPEATPEPTVTKKPEATTEPTVTKKPAATPEPTVTKKPEATPEPTVTKKPEATPEPTVTKKPAATPKPTVTKKPEVTPEPTVTKKPEATPKPTVTKKPEVTPEPTVPVPEEDRLDWKKMADLTAEVLRLQQEGKTSMELLALSGLWRTEEAQGKHAPDRVDAYVLLYRLAQKNGENGDSRVLDAVRRKNRLTDLGNLKEEERMAAQFLYANGVVEGESNGLYSGTRKMNGTKELTEKQFLLYLKRLVGQEPRRQLTEDGQLIRTDNLPEFAEYYAYILEDYPNSFYEWEFQFMKSMGGYVAAYVSPAEMRQSEKTLGGLTYGTILDEFGESYAEFAKEYLLRLFSVDYRKTPKDSDWYSYILENNAGTVSFAGMDGPDYLQYRINQYLSDIQTNHTILECDFAAADVSTIYYTSGEWFVRCYLHYRIVSADSTELVDIYRGQVEFSETFVGDYQNVVPGEWRDGYLDVKIRPDPDRNRVYVREVYFSDYAYRTRVQKKK